MTITYFLGTAMIFKDELKNLTYKTTTIRNENKTINITEYSNGSIPDLNFNTPVPDFKLNVIIPVVSAMIGSQTTLTCSGNYDQHLCSFTSPKGKTYSLNSKFDSDENGRIRNANGNAKVCDILIVKVIPEDDGVWHCNVNATKNEGQYYRVDHDEVILRAFYDENLQASITSAVLKRINLTYN